MALYVKVEPRDYETKRNVACYHHLSLTDRLKIYRGEIVTCGARCPGGRSLERRRGRGLIGEKRRNLCSQFRFGN